MAGVVDRTRSNAIAGEDERGRTGGKPTTLPVAGAGGRRRRETGGRVLIRIGRDSITIPAPDRRVLVGAADAARRAHLHCERERKERRGGRRRRDKCLRWLLAEGAAARQARVDFAPGSRQADAQQLLVDSPAPHSLERATRANQASVIIFRGSSGKRSKVS